MTVPEQVQDAIVEEHLLRATAVPAMPQVAGPNWLRLAYAAEYLLALQTVLPVWTQVGGQGHMDLLPWYLKLVCAAAWAWCAVRLTAALVEASPNRRSVRVWATSVLAVSIVMGCITFYYHSHEVQDEPDSDETSTTSVSISEPGQAFHAV